MKTEKSSMELEGDVEMSVPTDDEWAKLERFSVFIGVWVCHCSIST